jgi:hypothetical protein
MLVSSASADGDSSGTETIVRLTANVSPAVADALAAIASKRGVTMTEALRQSISHEKYRLEAERRGKRFLLLNRKSGRMREVAFG